MLISLSHWITFPFLKWLKESDPIKNTIEPNLKLAYLSLLTKGTVCVSGGWGGVGFPAFSFPHDGVSCSFSSFLVQPLPTYSFWRGTQFAFILTASQPEFRCRDKGHKSPCLGSDW